MPVEAFELAGELQGVVNAAEGAQAVAGAWGARVETTMRESGPWERVHPVGYVDAMAAAEMSLATGVTEGLAGRKAALGAALGERFPAMRDLVLSGDLAVSSAHKVVEACAGLDVDACLRVDADLAPRLAAMDPARVTSAARTVAATGGRGPGRRARRDDPEVPHRRGPPGGGRVDGVVRVPADCDECRGVVGGGEPRRGVPGDGPALTVPESRADAFGDLLLRNVDVTAKVTLGIPVVTGAPDPAPAAAPVRFRYDWDDDDTIVDHDTGEVVRFGDLARSPARSCPGSRWAPNPTGTPPPSSRP